MDNDTKRRQTVPVKFAAGTDLASRMKNFAAARALPVIIKKPPKGAAPAGVETISPRLPSELCEHNVRVSAAKATSTNTKPSYRFLGGTGTAVTLSKERTRARLDTRGGQRQSRLVVRGCGPVPTRPARKFIIVEATAMGKNSRLAGYGITCDGETVLPKRTTQVRFELRDREATVEVTVEYRPAGSRKKYGPKRWVKRRIEKPVKGRWRRPKPSI
jgi:hypothetical protein